MNTNILLPRKIDNYLEKQITTYKIDNVTLKDNLFRKIDT